MAFSYYVTVKVYLEEREVEPAEEVLQARAKQRSSTFLDEDEEDLYSMVFSFATKKGALGAADRLLGLPWDGLTVSILKSEE